MLGKCSTTDLEPQLTAEGHPFQLAPCIFERKLTEAVNNVYPRHRSSLVNIDTTAEISQDNQAFVGTSEDMAHFQEGVS